MFRSSGCGAMESAACAAPGRRFNLAPCSCGVGGNYGSDLAPELPVPWAAKMAKKKKKKKKKKLYSIKIQQVFLFWVSDI